MHWHAYQWTGPGVDRGNEAERRPASPDFPSSLVPPMRTGDWLAKPAARITRTFDEPRRAAGWMAAEYAKARDLLLLPERVPLEERLETAVDLLSRGVDVQWGEWLQGGRFVTIGVICCPNRHVSHPCPIRRPAT
ncbi:hypothetical protein [Nonomuraea gerenzanensis]|uniref:Uncharacterized protein n=1 Tax=Nonomuraea gerenzanensis TaxID=93944 RepID=A0A1M4DZL0_9ACTN|nr:hypothetical protein [Nonomuraea gerenzanensis]UBU14283.1 hypothetical protein LCN96_04435 [Nonomuraea gerenzanensis]SBO91984.1 hypothetical protein BN4615_P1498 [Nonomuraea gerenzanensis]